MIRTVEVRGSDYLGAGAVSPMTVLVLPKVLAGKRAWAPADLDAPHSWTYTGDVARTLVAVGSNASAWGRAWHVPTGPPQSFHEVAARAAELAGVAAPRLSAMPYPVAAQCANEAFRDRVRSGRPDRGADDADVGAGEHCVEGGGEVAVSVADQEPKLFGAIAEVHEQVAGLLGDPVPGGVGARNSVHLMRPADTREAARRVGRAAGRCGSRLLRAGAVVVGERPGRECGVAGDRCSGR